MESADEMLRHIRQAPEAERERAIADVIDAATNRIKAAIHDALRLEAGIRLARKLRNGGDAQELVRRAVALARVLEDPPLLQKALLALAAASDSATEAATIAREACAVDPRENGPSARVRREAAAYLIRADDFVGAIRLLEPLIAELDRIDDPVTLLWNYSAALRGSGRFADAVASTRIALEKAAAAGEDERIASAIALDGADAALDGGDHHAASDFLSALPSALPDKIAFHRRLVEARLAGLQGNSEQRNAIAREALEFATRKWGEASPQAVRAAALVTST
jgi:hypothetical protein